jgi:hypothetical protein
MRKAIKIQNKKILDIINNQVKNLSGEEKFKQMFQNSNSNHFAYSN